MHTPFKLISGSVTAPQGFLASGVFCDLKRLGTGKGSNKGRKRDLGLIVSEVLGSTAGLFTTNQVCAAPVKVCAQRVPQGQAQAIVANSGNANACTGTQGRRDAIAMTEITAQALSDAGKGRREASPTPQQRRPSRANGGIRAEHVLVASTGRIGVKLPMAQVKSGIQAATRLLGQSDENARWFAEAIMTSDTRPKEIAIEFRLDGKTVRMGGVCKGAGMIQPGMSSTGLRPASVPAGVGGGCPSRSWHATMLCFITTDAAIAAPTLQAALAEAVARSFNRITVDGDMSTNDTVLALANGLAGNALLADVGAAELDRHGGKAGGASAGLRRDLAVFQSALNHVCLELAKMIVRDGEGVSRFITVRVKGARTFAEADAAARAVANSALVKTSWCGGDPNWGRILDALGYSSAQVAEDRVDLAYSAPGSRKLVYSLRRGQPTRTPFRTLCEVVAAKEFDLHINLNLGRASAVIYTADLTEEYVEFNKGDVSDPASLGG